MYQNAAPTKLRTRMAMTKPIPAFAPELIPPLLPEELLLCVVGLDDLLEPRLALVTGLTGSTAVAGAGTDVVAGGEGLVGVGINGSPEAGEGLVGEGLTGIPEGGGAMGGGSGCVPGFLGG